MGNFVKSDKSQIRSKLSKITADKIRNDLLSLATFILHNALYITLRCSIFSMTRHNVKTRKEFMKHQLLRLPPESSEIKRKAKKKIKGMMRGKAEPFPAVERQKKSMDEER